jgi:glycosyltransferase involved in cell wall biosynthesis
MRVGIANEETWSFLHEIYADLAEHHDVSLYKRRTFHLPIFNSRVNRYLFYKDMRSFLTDNDVVFFEWASELLAVATHLPKECGIVVRLHRYEMYKWIERINWDAVDVIIVVSEAKRKEFVARLPDQASKLVVINEAVSLDKFKPYPKQFSGDIGTLCHLTPRKRVYDLILTFAELIQERDDLHLHIGGGQHRSHGDYYQAMLKAVDELDLQEKVTFYGHQSEPATWYRNIDIFVSNSFSEGLQVAPIEAMASGCYCLSHAWDGADELLPESNLYLTDRQLQSKILAYCEASAAVKQEKQSLMRSIVHDKFDINQTKAKVRQLIEDAGVGTATAAVPTRQMSMPRPTSTIEKDTKVHQ